MHLYVMTRGIKWAVDRFITQLQGKCFPMKLMKGGKSGKKVVEVAVRPIQLWEIVYPREAHDLMVNALIDNDKTQHRKHRKWVAVLRKILGVKKLQKTDRDGMKFPIFKDHIEIIGIGCKEDRDITTPDGITYEGL